MGIVYKLYFKSRPKTIYIGKTDRKLSLRYTQHISTANSNRKTQQKLYNWIRKYFKKEKLLIEVIFEGRDTNALEIKAIRKFKKLGYILKNSTDGGEGVSGFKYSEEQREKVRQRNLKDGRWKGESNFFYGKTGELNHASRKTYQYSISGEFICCFGSAIEASRKIHGNNKPISKARFICRAIETNEIAYGYQWRAKKYKKIKPFELTVKKMSNKDINVAKKMLRDGFSVNKISEILGFSRCQINNKLNIIPVAGAHKIMKQSDIKRANELVKKGLSINKISKKLGFNQKQIKSKITVKYVPLRRKMTKKDIIKAQKMRDKGMTAVQVGRKLGVGKGQILENTNNHPSFKRNIMSDNDILKVQKMRNNGYSVEYISSKTGFSGKQIHQKTTLPPQYKRNIMSKKDINKAQEMYNKGISTYKIHLITGFSRGQIKRKIKLNKPIIK